MSRNLISRRAGVLAAVVAAGVVGTAGPALADVTVNPPSAPQGTGQNVHFTVANTTKNPITEVKLVLPADNPVAEVFPLSVDEWAPRIEHRTLDTPLTSIHGGQPVTQTAASITWIKVNGPLAPGASTDLAVSLGPLPMTSTLTFTVVPTYAGGTTGPAMPPVSMTLTPAPGGQAPAHGGHGGTTGGTGGAPDAEDAAFAGLVAQAQDDGPGFWSIAGWVIAGLALAGAAVLVIRGRRPAADPAADANDGDGDGPDDGAGHEPKEPVAAGARVTAWSYRDGPAE